MINSIFHSLNRQKIITATKGGLIILSAYSLMQSDNDLSSKFVQEANFWYLTGINDPDWQVIIDGTRNRCWLVKPNINSSQQVFDGSLSNELASKISGIDNIISQNEAMDMLRNLSRIHSVVHTIGKHPDAKYFDFCLNPAPNKLRKDLERLFGDVRDCRLELSKLRAIKQPEEVSAIKKAIKLTVNAFNEVKLKLPTLKYEYEVEAEFTYCFRKNGAIGYACDPIVASGINACTLHYDSNDSKLRKNSLLLLDICARLNGYPSDISRTYAISQPTERQIAVHDAVDSARQQIIAILRPGLSISDYQRQSDEIMKDSLKKLDLLSSLDSFRKYFPHAISHGLGVDVHDSLGKTNILLPGMVLTVEPGIYIPDEAIGVRIEDDILITDTGHTNLSAGLPTSL
ncbi:MAG: Xaa-Pro aminopeptidase [Patescibacteria group bacterium]|nr:Xaa-Pro aminopeptidase [Patescibacteria group bacterium]